MSSCKFSVLSPRVYYNTINKVFKHACYLFCFTICVLTSTYTFAETEEVNGNQLRISYQSEGFCSLHYRLNNGNQLNHPMNSLGSGNYDFIIPNLSNGDEIRYYITYQQGGLAYDTEEHTYIYGEGDTVGSDRSPYLGAPVSIPGTVLAENYDFGGEGIASYDSTDGNAGGEYRTDNVDIQSSSIGGFNIGWIEPGEWLEYTVDVVTAGTYDIVAQVASPSQGGSIHFEFSGATNTQSNTINFAGTNNWQSWATTDSATVQLNSGTHVVRLALKSGRFNIHSFLLSLSDVDEGGDHLPAAYPGYTGVYQGFTLVQDDRFSELDNSFWETGDGGFTENDCRFVPQGVQFADGVMSLTIQEENIPASWSYANENWVTEKNYSCGELRSKNEYLYGRFEARIRNPNPAQASGYISSLFTYRNKASENFRWREIDVEMEGVRPSKFQANLIFGEGTWEWSRTRNWGAYEEKIEIGNTSEWKVYAIEWTNAHIKWYVDGVLKKTLTQSDVDGIPLIPPQQYPAKIPELAQKAMMNFWIPNDLIQNDFGGNKIDNVYPMKAEYDWFRYYSWTP